MILQKMQAAIFGGWIGLGGIWSLFVWLLVLLSGWV
jgi:hypothetical protein